MKKTESCPDMNSRMMIHRVPRGDSKRLLNSLRKTVGKVSPILVTLTSRNDSDFESSNVSLKENKPDGVNPNSNDINYYVRKNEGKIRWVSADCKVSLRQILKLHTLIP